MEVNTGILLVGLAFFAFSNFLLIRNLKSRKRCTVGVTGEVVNYFIEEEHSEDGDRVVYYPIMRYSVANQSYEKKTQLGTNRRKYEIGAQVPLLYDPEKPEDFIIAGDQSGFVVAIIGIALGVAVSVLSFFAH